MKKDASGAIHTEYVFEIHFFFFEWYGSGRKKR